MSDYDDEIVVYDGEFEDLYREGSLTVEDDPVPAPPVDELESLACGEGQLFTDSQLVQLVNETPQDPAESPAPRSAEVKLALQATPISDWAEHLEQEEQLLASDVDEEEEQQDTGDHQEFLPPVGGASDQEVSQGVVEQVPYQLFLTK